MRITQGQFIFCYVRFRQMWRPMASKITRSSPMQLVSRELPQVPCSQRPSKDTRSLKDQHPSLNRTHTSRTAWIAWTQLLPKSATRVHRKAIITDWRVQFSNVKSFKLPIYFSMISIKKCMRFKLKKKDSLPHPFTRDRRLAWLSWTERKRIAHC